MTWLQTVLSLPVEGWYRRLLTPSNSRLTRVEGGCSSIHAVQSEPVSPGRPSTISGPIEMVATVRRAIFEIPAMSSRVRMTLLTTSAARSFPYSKALEARKQELPAPVLRAFFEGFLILLRYPISDRSVMNWDFSICTRFQVLTQHRGTPRSYLHSAEPENSGMGAEDRIYRQAWLSKMSIGSMRWAITCLSSQHQT